MWEVAKSEGDKRHYRYCSLDNGLQCLLISDSETDYGAASLSVASGSLSDPREVQGLAHFLEHMLFLGTERYPAENTYRAFIKPRSGNFNAFTANEETNFYFTIAQEHLQPALHIFAQFFICPLFTEDCVDREMNAVDSENQKNLKSDLSRFSQLLCSLAEESHPYHHFGTGNLSTLKLTDIRERLIARFQQHYLASSMRLAVYGKESLDELQVLAQEYFSPIRNIPQDPISISSQPWNCLGSVLKVKSVMERRELKLLWPWPAVQQFYASKPQLYLAHLIGHEGKNSILSLLKSKGLAQEIGVGIRTSLRDLSVFAVNIVLTEAGMREWETVAEVVFAYIDMLQSQDLQEWVFQELQSMAAIHFRFKSKENAMDYVHTVTSAMQKYPANSVLTASHLLTAYEPERIRQLLELLKPRKAVLTLVWDKWSGEELGSVEKWYGTQYGIAPMSEALVKRLESPLTPSVPDKVLDYPPHNPYIPSLFSFIESLPQSIPSLVYSQPGVALYYMPDISFSKDSVKAFIYLKCPDAGLWTMPLTALLGTLWVKLLRDRLREISYLATKAGLHLTIAKKAYGLGVTLGGFSQYFQTYLHDIFSALANFHITEDLKDSFTEHLDELRKTLRNARLMQPHLQAKGRLSDLLYANFHFSGKAKRRAAASCTFEDLGYFAGKWLRNLRVDWLVLGNITAEAAISLAKTCSSCVLAGKTQTLTGEDLTPMRNYSVEPFQPNIVYQKRVLDPTNNNSASLCYWEAGPVSLAAQAALQVLESLFKEPCFSYLRTQQQLGYSVFSATRVKRGILGHTITVQSHRFPPGQLTQHISTFISRMEDTIAHLTDEEFAVHQAAVLTSVLRKDLSLKKRFCRFKSEVVSGRLSFEWKEQLGSAVTSLTRETLQATFLQVFGTANKRIDVEMTSNRHQEQQRLYDQTASRRQFSSAAQVQKLLPIFPSVY